MDLTVTIAGVKFPSCLMNASGALCVTAEELTGLGRSRSGAIVTKSMTVEAREGNPEPRYHPFAGGSINSMGLPNLGYRAYAELIPALKQFGKPLIASVAGLCEDDFPVIAKVINAAAPDLIEVNLSCPNIPGKPQIGYDAEASERLIKRVRPLIAVPMGVKLPPYFDPAHHELMGSVIEFDQLRRQRTLRESRQRNGRHQAEGRVRRARRDHHQTGCAGQCPRVLQVLQG